MISLYILLIAIVAAIFGLVVTIFSHVKKVDRSKRMGHFFLFFGILVALIAGFSMNQERKAHDAAVTHRKQLRSQQMYDAGLIHLSSKKAQIKDGQAKITVHVSKNTAVKITSNHKQLQPLTYKPNKTKKDIEITFVMPGKYTVTATRGENKVVKHMQVMKDTHKHTKASSSSQSESSSEEVVEPASSEKPIVEEPSSEAPQESVSEEQPTSEVVDEAPAADTGVASAPAEQPATPPAAPSYQPVWTPTPATSGADAGVGQSSDAGETGSASETVEESAPTDAEAQGEAQ